MARVLCGAKTRNGGTCQKPPIKGRTRCRLHGGASHPGGPDHPRWKDGKRSKYQLPERLAERVEQALADPELLSLRNEIAVLDARLAEMLVELDSATAVEQWDRVSDTWDRVKSSAGDERVAALEAHEAAINGGRHEALAWVGIERTMESRRKLVESERRAEIEADTMMSVTAVLSAMTRLMGMVYQRITEGFAASLSPQQIILGIRGDYARLCHHSSATPQDESAGPAG